MGLAGAFGAAGLVGSLVGSVVNASGQQEQAQAQSEAAAYQAQVAQNNAAIAQQNAKLDIQAGETAAVNQGLKTRAAVGTARANQGASGVDPNTGSASAVQAGQQEIGYLDALTLRSDAAKKAYGQEVAATSDTAQAGLEELEAGQAQEAGTIGEVGTLLSGASTVGTNFANMQNKGVFKSIGSGGGGFISDTAIY
jgi:hypothetical protein